MSVSVVRINEVIGAFDTTTDDVCGDKINTLAPKVNSKADLIN